MMDAQRQRQRRDSPQWDVFLSYVRRDGWRIAERIEEGLEQRGLSVWRYDARLSVGDDVSAGIEEALADSAYMVAVVSPMYARRPPRAVRVPGGEPGGPRMGILPVLHRTRPSYVAYRIPALDGAFMRRWDVRYSDSLLDDLARIAGGGEEGPGGEPGRLDESLLSRDESDVLEFKSWPGSRPGVDLKAGRMEEKIARELCSFANTRGGDLLIGVGDDGRAEGFTPEGGRLPRKERDERLAWMANVVAEYIGAEHSGRFCFEIVEVDGTDILHCTVDASRDGPVILRRKLEGKHDFFMRSGSTCRALDSREMIEYMEKKWPRPGGGPGRPGGGGGGPRGRGGRPRPSPYRGRRKRRGRR